ncbi:hypothetical protein CMV_016722 [Castanea mollissima]|uniref:Mediator of RNA polymerase II transcription subunit 25 n=1 Tax=Castanea mollissima TaxID=60419 RepID=A0A8J4VRE3_9ROSI|nr:hypothetical protein CMV_016722 [Castanea mollissima]
MAAKRLVIVVDGTAAMGPYWRTIVSDYLEKIIRYFCGQSRGQEYSGQIVELGVVMYKAHDGKGLKVRRSGWSRDMEKFIEWLLAFDFEGCGQDNAAIAEGLADALVMFPKPANGTEAGQYFLGERHCILVAASNPYPIPSQLELPKISDGFCGVETYLSTTDAKIVAEMFIQGNDSHNGTDPSLYNAKHPQFLVLLSEKFLEAHAALYQCETMSTSSINSAVAVGTSSVPMNSNFRLALPGYKFTNPAKNVTIILNLFVGLPQDQNNSPAGNIPTETSTVPAESQDWCVPPHDFSTSIPISGQTSSLSYSFKEEITEEEIMGALSPEKFTLSQNTSTTNPTSVCGGTPPEIMTSAADAGENSGGHSIMSTVKENPHDDTSVFDWRSLLRATQSTESTSKHLCSITSASGNLNNSKPAELGSMSTEVQGPSKSNESQGVTSQALAGTSESLQSTTDSSFISSSFISGNFEISQPEILRTTYAGIHSPHFSMLSPIAKSEALSGTSQTTQNLASLFTSKTSKLSGNLRNMQHLASLRRTIGKNRLQSKKRQRGQLGVPSHRGRSVSIVKRSQHISGGTEMSAAIDLEQNYVKAWEGDISAKRKDKVIIVSRLKAYRKKSAPEMLTADWPQTLQIVCEIPQRLINKTPYDGHADYMIFEASNDHRVYEQFRKKELCVRIDLPSQTLIFTPTGAPCRFIGTLFPGDCPLYKSCEQEQNDQATADESAMNETD